MKTPRRNSNQLKQCIARSIEKFWQFICHLLESRDLIKSLIYAPRNSSDNYSSRQIAQHDDISQFTSDIHYVKGEENTVADDLSRAWDHGIDLDRMAIEREQFKCEDKSKILQIQRTFTPSRSSSIISDVLAGKPRPLVRKHAQIRFLYSSLTQR